MAAPCTLTCGEENKTNSKQMGTAFDPDEWLFNSIKSYQNLHMFELIHPTKTIAWIEDKDICVASFHKDSKNEIHQLSLPDKLTSRSEAEDNFSCKRDFTVTGGGFNQRPIECIQYHSDNRIISSEQCENCLRVWKLSDSETDVIQQKSHIANLKTRSEAAKFAFHANEPSRLIFGSCTNNVCLFDVSSETHLSHKVADSEIDDDISFMNLIDQNTLVACSKHTGALWVVDTRANLVFKKEGDVTGRKDGALWTGCTMHAGKDLAKIARANDQGVVCLHDSRNFNKPLAEVCTGLENPGSGDIAVQMAPLNSSLLSISGFDSCVHVYDTASLSTNDRTDTVEAVFSHRGHLACTDNVVDSVSVLTHTWHPWQPNLILSSASDGTLHAWQYSV